MKIWSFLLASPQRFALAVAVLVCAGGGLSGCASLLPKPVAAPTLYILEAKAAPATALPSNAPAQATARVTLVVNTPRADAGFDSPHMMYVREPYKLEYFVHSEWVDTPSRMLLPMIVLSVGKAGAFKTVVPATIAATGELTLDAEIVRLQQDFSVKPSRVVFTVRVYVLDTQTRKTIAWRELEAVVAATSDDPAGGVVAANRAVQIALQQVADFCVEAEKLWQASRQDATSLKR
ncbi:MAG: membrane integrity-associated transporter subunit PqiC [Rhizobacter sp.]|nr:membrane integrity-associated transporter subunit PqiC [Burkholderiales bacterium]